MSSKFACQTSDDCTHAAECHSNNCFCLDTGTFCQAKPKPSLNPKPAANPTIIDAKAKKPSALIPSKMNSKFACQRDEDCTHDAECNNNLCFCYHTGTFCQAKPKPSLNPKPAAKPTIRGSADDQPKIPADPFLCVRNEDCRQDAMCMLDTSKKSGASANKRCICYGTSQSQCHSLAYTKAVQLHCPDGCPSNASCDDKLGCICDSNNQPVQNGTQCIGVTTLATTKVISATGRPGFEPVTTRVRGTEVHAQHNETSRLPSVPKVPDTTTKPPPVRSVTLGDKIPHEAIHKHQIAKVFNFENQTTVMMSTPEGPSVSVVLSVVLPLCVVLFLGVLLVVICLRRQRQHRLGPKRGSEAVLKSGDGVMLLDRMNNINKNPTYFVSSGDDATQRKFAVREICMDHVVLVDVVGEGAFGQVYRGELYCPETESSQLVAVKVLKENVSNEIREDFEREVEIMSAFDHDNILKLVGVVTQNAGQSPYMIFEYMMHGDLAELLRTTDNSLFKKESGNIRLQKPDLVDIATQIANGMQYLTSQHFVHRDLATRNCLVGEELVVKISDFGMSRDIYTCDYYKIGGSRMLPVRWMSPESVKYGRFTSESDAWACGVVLWEIFSYGRQPYYGHSNEEVVRFLDAGILLQRPEDCPSTIYHIMLGCWKADPKERLSFEKIRKHLHDYHQRLVEMAAASRSQPTTPVDSERGSQIVIAMPPVAADAVDGDSSPCPSSESPQPKLDEEEGLLQDKQPDSQTSPSTSLKLQTSPGSGPTIPTSPDTQVKLQMSPATQPKLQTSPGTQVKLQTSPGSSSPKLQTSPGVQRVDLQQQGGQQTTKLVHEQETSSLKGTPPAMRPKPLLKGTMSDPQAGGGGHFRSSSAQQQQGRGGGGGGGVAPTPLEAPRATSQGLTQHHRVQPLPDHIQPRTQEMPHSPDVVFQVNLPSAGASTTSSTTRNTPSPPSSPPKPRDPQQAGSPKPEVPLTLVGGGPPRSSPSPSSSSSFLPSPSHITTTTITAGKDRSESLEKLHRGMDSGFSSGEQQFDEVVGGGGQLMLAITPTPTIVHGNSGGGAPSDGVELEPINGLHCGVTTAV